MISVGHRPNATQTPTAPRVDVNKENIAKQIFQILSGMFRMPRDAVRLLLSAADILQVFTKMMHTLAEKTLPTVDRLFGAHIFTNGQYNRR